MRREEKIARGKGQRAESRVELHPVFYRVILNSGVLSLSSGLSTTQPEAKYESEEDCIALSRQLSTTMQEAKYHLAVDYPKVAHGVLSLSSGLSTTQQKAKYGSETGCITLSPQLSTTMPEAKYHSAVDYPNVAHGVLTVSIAPEKSGQAVDLSQRTTEANSFGLQPHSMWQKGQVQRAESKAPVYEKLFRGVKELFPRGNKLSTGSEVQSYPVMRLVVLSRLLSGRLLSGRLVHSALTNSFSKVYFKNTPANGGINRTDELGFVGLVINN